MVLTPELSVPWIFPELEAEMMAKAIALSFPVGRVQIVITSLSIDAFESPNEITGNVKGGFMPRRARAVTNEHDKKGFKSE
jgi:hypothetical protein